MNFGDYLNGLIVKRGYSFRQLAMFAGIDHTYISKMVKGKMGPPSPDILKKLARPLNVSYGELMLQAGYITKEEADKIEPSEQDLLDKLDSVIKNSTHADGTPLDEPTRRNIGNVVRSVIQGMVKK